MTVAFLNTLERLLRCSSDARAFVALERRINFTIELLAPTAKAEDFFLRELDRRSGSLRYKRVLESFPQRFDYDRTDLLVRPDK